MMTLFETGEHQNVMFHDMTSGEMVQANQHLIVANGDGIILDPGGHKVYQRLFSQSAAVIQPTRLRYIFCSHQDPDIVAGLNGWLLVTDATALVPAVWSRFIHHFGVEDIALARIQGIPDEGMDLALGTRRLLVIPAHFLHSPGNFQVYDPTSRILYSGDLGASLGVSDFVVHDFDAHVPHMLGFHRRYMASNRALRVWARRVRQLDVETIAPQHGAIFRGRQTVERLITWLEGLACGTDLLGGAG